MATYIDDITQSSSGHGIAEPEGLPTWCAFALGGIVTFLFVYIGVGRPAAHELSLLRRQMNTLEQSVWEVAGQEDTVASTNELLGLLNDQREQMREAKETLVEMRRLHEQLAAEAQRVQTAMVAVSQLGSLKDMLLSNADRAEQAAAVLSVSEDLYHRLATAADTTALAVQAGDDLLTLRRDLVNGCGDIGLARENLADLVHIRAALGAEGEDVALAQDRVTDLISLKDSVVAQTDNLADAIETLELTSELGVRFHEAALSFEQIRHWMVEVVAVQPMLQQTKAAIEPLLELTNLRRMAPQQLRQIARMVTQSYHQDHLASNAEVDAASDRVSLASESDATFTPAVMDDSISNE